MRIYTKIIIDPNGDVLEQEGYEYAGPVAECKGASQQEKDQAAAQADLAKRQSAFYDVMTASYQKMFAGQTAILDSLTKSFGPILAAGPGQYGFTKAEDSALRTMSSEGVAQAYKMQKQSLAEAQGARSSDAFIPQGATQQIQAQLTSQAAAQESGQQLGITQKGYDVGREQYWKAAEALGGAAHEMNPTGYAGQASGAAGEAGKIGDSAFSMDKTIYEQNKAASGWGIAGSILGAGLGAVGTALAGPIGGAIGSKIGGAFGGAHNVTAGEDARANPWLYS